MRFASAAVSTTVSQSCFFAMDALRSRRESATWGLTSPEALFSEVQ